MIDSGVDICVKGPNISHLIGENQIMTEIMLCFYKSTLTINCTKISLSVSVCVAVRESCQYRGEECCECSAADGRRETLL